MPDAGSAQGRIVKVSPTRYRQTKSLRPWARPYSVLPEGLRGEECGGKVGDTGRNLLVLGVEELDEALQETRPLLHLALPGFEQILRGGQGKMCFVSRS